MTDLTPERLQELRRIAEAATPGPWGTTRYNGGLRFDGPLRVYAGTDPEYGEPRPIPASDADTRYTAAFDPTTVLAMLYEIERLRAEVEARCRHTGGTTGRSRSPSRAAGGGVAGGGR